MDARETAVARTNASTHGDSTGEDKLNGADSTAAPGAKASPLGRRLKQQRLQRDQAVVGSSEQVSGVTG
jgi:hypothetical protein